MKLLFDQNLSPHLTRLLADIYPDSIHVREVGLREAGDSEIWEYAKENGFVIVSKDADFQQRGLLRGAPRSSFGCALEIALCRELRTCSGAIQQRFTRSIWMIQNLT